MTAISFPLPVQRLRGVNRCRLIKRSVVHEMLLVKGRLSARPTCCCCVAVKATQKWAEIICSPARLTVNVIQEFVLVCFICAKLLALLRLFFFLPSLLVYQLRCFSRVFKVTVRLRRWEETHKATMRSRSSSFPALALLAARARCC